MRNSELTQELRNTAALQMLRNESIANAEKPSVNARIQKYRSIANVAKRTS